MNSKLTLSINKEVIDAAKDYAKSQGRSLSNVIKEHTFNAVIEELCGSVKLPHNKTYDDIKTEALMEKYLKP